MYNVYVTNKSKRNVYVRLQSQKLSSLDESFYYELDKLTSGRENRKDHKDGLQSTSCVNSYLMRWGFCIIPKEATMPFLAEVGNDETRMYASLYACSKLWIVDYEVYCTWYGCVFVQFKESSPLLNARTARSPERLFYLSQANPEPVWIPEKSGNHVYSLERLIRTGVDAADGAVYFGRSSVRGGTPCRVTTHNYGSEFDKWYTVNGDHEESGELLRNTGYELVRAKTGDRMPPHAVIVGISDTDGTIYLGRVGGNIPCSVSSEDGRIKNFSFFSGEVKQVESGKIMVLTK
ncbi:uncharacterized protein LOC144656468 [Oculina patagonica]